MRKLGFILSSAWLLSSLWFLLSILMMVEAEPKTFTWIPGLPVAHLGISVLALLLFTVLMTLEELGRFREADL